jgi:hypothetical protein
MYIDLRYIIRRCLESLKAFNERFMLNVVAHIQNIYVEIFIGCTL